MSTSDHKNTDRKRSNKNDSKLSSTAHKDIGKNNNVDALSSVNIALKSTYWLAKKKHAKIESCSADSATIVSPSKLKVGQKITLSITSEFLCLRHLSAEIVAANISFDPKESAHKYKIRFIFDKVPKIASDTIKNMLLQVDKTISQAQLAT